MRGQARREAQEAEHHVLHARAHVGLADGACTRWAPRPPAAAPPRRRARRGSRARSPPRAACRGSGGCRRCSGCRRARRRRRARSSFSSPGWYSSRWPTISTRPASRAAATTRSASAADCASGFSTKQCLPAASTRSASSACVGTGVATTTASSASVGQQLVQVGRRARIGEGRRRRARAPRRAVAEPGELGAGQAVEVARQVRAPVAEPDDARPAPAPALTGAPGSAPRFPRVTPRKSTTSGAPATTASTSRPGWAVTITAQSASSSASSSGSLRQVEVGQLAARGRRGRPAPPRARRSSRMILIAGDSRRSPTPGL